MTGHFSGSYEPQDVQFLLKRLDNVQLLDGRSKEAFIQGGGHYSEILSPESAPSPAYMELFHAQLSANASRLAEDILVLARKISCRVPTGPVTLVSLARAGTPIGVLLGRVLRELSAREVKHYSVSIIRDRGLDLNALQYIRERHADESIVFIDGWTGKGVIGQELRRSVSSFNADNGARVNPDLFVVADIAGTAAVCATHEDYLIPSAVLNSTVSGLVSRTVVNGAIRPEDFHGCLHLTQLTAHDQSRQFIHAMWTQIVAQHAVGMVNLGVRGYVDAVALHQTVERLRVAYGYPSRNFVKPGVGEATRVMLRRVPELLVVKDATDDHVAHLVHLAEQKRVPIQIDVQLPCRAVALIEQLD